MRAGEVIEAFLEEEDFESQNLRIQRDRTGCLKIAFHQTWEALNIFPAIGL